MINKLCRKDMINRLNWIPGNIVKILNSKKVKAVFWRVRISIWRRRKIVSLSWTLFWRNPNIFSWDQKSDTFVYIWLILLLKMKDNVMAIEHNWMKKGFNIIFNYKNNLICDSLNKIMKVRHFFTKIRIPDIFCLFETLTHSRGALTRL